MKHGAVIVRGGSVLACGVNKARNHPSLLESAESIRLNASTHAEADALRKLRYEVQPGATIYVARVNKYSLARMSRPCDMCMKDLLRYGIKEVVYTV